MINFYFNSLISFMAASYMLAYYKVHANGKRIIRLYSAVVLYIASALFLFSDGEFLHIWYMVIVFIPVIDTYIDWRIKAKGR